MMSEKMTTICLPYCEWPGYMDYGEISAKDMIEMAKQFAREDIILLSQIIDADPDEFRVELVRGKIVQRRIKIIQQGKL